MINDLISVIVPVYNVENYLNKCVQSILDQTYDNIEIILIDDGSTDASGIICDSLAKKYDKIRVYHQENQGLGPARNTGLAHINGKYVAFVDSDDWVEKETYSYLYQQIKRSGCDIVTCGRKIVSDAGVLKNVYVGKEKQLTQKEAVRQFLLQKEMNMSACDKLYAAKLFDNVRFPANYVSEDIVPIYTVIKESTGVYLTGKPFYNYYSRLGSLSKSKFTSKNMGTCIYSLEVAEDVKYSYPDLLEEANYYELDAILGVYRAIRRSCYSGKEKDELYQVIKKRKKDILDNRYMYKRQKIYALLALARVDILPDKIYVSLKRTMLKHKRY